MTADHPLHRAHVAEEKLDTFRNGLSPRLLEGRLRGVDGHDSAALSGKETRLPADAATQIEHPARWSSGQDSLDQEIGSRLLLRLRRRVIGHPPMLAQWAAQARTVGTAVFLVYDDRQTPESAARDVRAIGAQP